jgi:hypothetical protein
MTIDTNDNAIIIALAYPDNFCAPSEERIAKLSYLLGIGKKDAIKAGHAALFLIHKTKGTIEYADFGRYLTPASHGRVRTEITDAELELPFSLDIHHGEIRNFQDILVWASTNPEKTHGEGNLYASVCSNINYQRAKRYIDSLQTRELVPYGIRTKNGSNCSRFVADTILAGSTSKKLTKRMKKCMRFTPSPLGIVKAADTEGFIYHAYNGHIQHTWFYAWKENIRNFFDRNHQPKPQSFSCSEPNAKFLKGLGSSAFFDIREHEQGKHIHVTRFNEQGKEDFRGIFTCIDGTFDPQKDFEVVHPSHCKTCTLLQDGKYINFSITERIR